MSEDAKPGATVRSGRPGDRSSQGFTSNSRLGGIPSFTNGNGKLDSITFDELLRQQRPLDTGHFDIDEVTFVAPSGIVDLAVAVTIRASSAGSRQLLVAHDSVRT